MSDQIPNPMHADRGKMIAEAVRRGGLKYFIQKFWHCVEPKEFQGNWHIDAICEYLDAVQAGDIKDLVINIPPGCMKPCAVSEPVWTKRGYIPLGDIQVGDEVLTHRGRWREVEAVHEQGALPLLAITTFSGRTVKVAPDHPMLTPRGWVQAQHLTTDDELALVEEDGDALPEYVTTEEARLAGYLVGDGTTAERYIRFTNADQDALEDFAQCAPWPLARKEKGTHADLLVQKPTANGAMAWLEVMGLRGASSYTKRIPPQILGGSKETLRHFLGAYWTCDGQEPTQADGPKRRGRAWRAVATTVSEGLALDLIGAFNRLGMRAHLRRKSRKLQTKKQPGGVYMYFEVEVLGQDSIAKLCRLPGLCERKRREYPLSGFPTVLHADPIVSIAPNGTGPCRCLTVAEDHSFTVRDFAVKNSLNVGVFWPAYLWAFQPSWQLLYGSFDKTLLGIQSQKQIQILTSPDYMAAFPETRLKSKKPATGEFFTTKEGYRFNTTPTGKGTGRHVDIGVVDDPLKPKDAAENSEAAFRTVDNWFDQTLPSRYRHALVVIMQRLHARDLAGRLIEEGAEALILPMRQTKYTMWDRDPRKEPGELLWPTNPRYTEEKVQKLEKRLGHAASAQLQQNPTPADGGFIEELWTRKEWIEIPTKKAGNVWCQSWDFSTKGTKESHSRVSGQLWLRTKNLTQYYEYLSTLDERQRNIAGAWGDRILRAIEHNVPLYLLVDWVGGHWNYVQSKAQFTMAQSRPYWKNGRIKLIEMQANGPALVEDMRRTMTGIIGVEPRGSKEERLLVHTEKWEEGLILYPPGRRGDEVREEHIKFPRFHHDDNVDTTTQALDRLANKNAAFRENLEAAAKAMGKKGLG